ncbi:hypothetical protein [Rhizobium terrae]|uniref:hypothetical protein n=1 Tax=Rhizobium terrae TaxID=2171756 RepID=UPI0013C2B31E|nr:hypothetical protein [Rhizobium terrae]
MELDLEAGWAYQPAKFGTRVDLSLENDCAGLTYLLNNGVPASHVDAIRANYRGELIVARSRKAEIISVTGLRTGWQVLGSASQRADIPFSMVY